MTTKPDILLVAKLPSYALAQLTNTYQVHDRIHEADAAAFKQLAPRIVGVVGSGESQVPSSLLEQLPRAGIVSIIGVGYDKVDVTAAKELGKVVTHTPNVLNDDVADLALALMLAVARQIPQADSYVRAKRWASEGAMPLARKLSGARVGIVGMGRIGKTIAKRCAAFDMSIAYTAKSAKKDLAFAFYPSAQALAAAVDFLVVITPGGAATQHLINAEVLQALGKDGYFINVARGSCVDQDALLTALQNKTIAGAGLDVFAQEPHVPEAFFALDNVVLTPHIGSATHATRKAMADLALSNLAQHLAGKPLLTPVPECQ